MRCSYATLVNQFYTSAGKYVHVHLRTSEAKFVPLQEFLNACERR